MITRLLSFPSLALVLAGFCFYSVALAQTPIDENDDWQSLESFLTESEAQGRPAYDAKALGAGDIITVKIKKVPDLSDQYTVDKNGKIDFPLIGMVLAQGQAPKDLAKNLEVLYEKDYLVNPAITVSIFAKRLPKERPPRRLTGPLAVPAPVPIVPQTRPVAAPLAIEPVAIIEPLPEPIMEPMPQAIELAFNNSPALTVTAIDTAPQAEKPPPTVPEILPPSVLVESAAESEAPSSIIMENPSPIITSAPAPAPTALEGSHWSIEGSKQDFIQFLSGGDMAGALGCNSFFARYAAGEQAITIKALTTTSIPCADNSKPQEFVDTLKTAKGYLIHQGELRILDEQSNQILFLQPK